MCNCVTDLSGEYILFGKTYSQVFNQLIFYSIFQSSLPFSNTPIIYNENIPLLAVSDNTFTASFKLLFLVTVMPRYAYLSVVAMLSVPDIGIDGYLFSSFCY